MHRCERSFFYRTENNLTTNFCVIISEKKKNEKKPRKKKRFIFNHMRLFYFKEKPTTPLRRGSKSMKKHIFQWTNLFVRRFLLTWKLLKHLWKRKKKKKGKKQINVIYKMMKAWMSKCRNILAFITMEIKDTKRERERSKGKRLKSSWAGT